MPILKFETKLVNGRPNIVFGTERQKQTSKKRDYKSKIQKYSLRNTGSDDFKEADQNNDVVENFSTIKQKKSAESSKDRNKERRNSYSSTTNRNYENDMYGSSNKRPVVNFSEKTQSKTKKESLFNFLKKDAKQVVENSHSYEMKSMSNDQPRNPRRKSLSDDDIDEIMRQVVLENKSSLSDDQLVDLLAKIYIEAKGGSNDMIIEPQKKGNIGTKDRDNREIRNEMDLRDLRNVRGPKESRDGNVGVPPLDINESERREACVMAPASAPLTMAQKKQMQWDMERRELAKITSYNPWGRPGCGAPINDQYEVHATETRQSRIVDAQPRADNYQHVASVKTPEPTGISQAEIKRRQWLSELNDQVAEKEKLKYQKDHHTQNPLLDQSDYKSSSNTAGDLSPGHGRGKGLANLNQITSEEMILKRHKQIEQQEAIKRQIEEKELLKRLDREKKAQLDQQEEMRINKEKLHIDSQYVNETARAKQREDESGRRFAQLRNQVEEAERAALLDKRMKRLQHLELAGHDTRQLRAGLVADQMTGRLAASTEFLSEDNTFSKIQQARGTSRNNYEVTPRSRYVATEDHGIQTDVEDDNNRSYTDEFESHRSHRVHRNRSVETVKEARRPPPRAQTNNIDGVSRLEMKKRDKAHFRIPSATVATQEDKQKSKRPESIGSRKPWGVKKINQKYVPQSKRDPFYSNTKDARETHKHDRVNQILAQVKANMDRIPDNEVGKGHLSDRHKRCDDRRAHDYDKENIAVNQGTYDLKNGRDGDYLHTDADGDRVQASVRYKDSYKQSTNQRSHRDPRSVPQRNPRTPEPKEYMWDNCDHEIVRTTDVLDPSAADQRCLVSREDTGRERARNSYYKSQNPGQLGEPIDKQYPTYKTHHNDQDKRDPLSYQQSHPTNRQNTILKQLSEIRADLRMRQKEIETSLSMNDDL